MTWTNQNLPRKVKIFDVTAKVLIKECNSLMEASEFTGVGAGNISRAIKKKWKCHTNALGKILAFR